MPYQQFYILLSLKYTLSPGWTKEEVEILKICLMKFGIGRWKKIIKCGCLPSKTISQMNLQTQRLLGQQSLAEFMGLHVHLDRVFNDNLKKVGPQVIRKNNFIINTGDNQTAIERDARIKLNKQKYGLKADEIKALKLPKSLAGNGKAKGGKDSLILSIDQIFSAKSNFSVIEKIQHLQRLQGALETKLSAIERRRMKKEEQKKYRAIKQSIIVQRQVNLEGKEEYEFVGISNIA